MFLRSNSYFDLKRHTHTGNKMSTSGLSTYQQFNQQLIFESINYRIDTRKSNNSGCSYQRRIIRLYYENLMLTHRIALYDTTIYTAMNLPLVGTSNNITEEFVKVLGKAGRDNFFKMYFKALPPLLAEKIMAKTSMAVSKTYEDSRVRDVDVLQLFLHYLAEMPKIVVTPIYKQVSKNKQETATIFSEEAVQPLCSQPVVTVVACLLLTSTTNSKYFNTTENELAALPFLNIENKKLN